MLVQSPVHVHFQWQQENTKYLEFSVKSSAFLPACQQLSTEPVSLSKDPLQLGGGGCAAIKEQPLVREYIRKRVVTQEHH